jgi:DNA-binding response OmpR family regulator
VAGKVQKDVLLVEPDDALRKLVYVALAQESLSCDMAADGDHALMRLKTGTYSVLLLDLLTPGVDGLQILQQMHSWQRPRNEDPIVLLMTASSDRGSLNAAADIIHAIVRKPFDMHALIELVCGCVNTRRNHQQTAFLAHRGARAQFEDA